MMGEQSPCSARVCMPRMHAVQRSRPPTGQSTCPSATSAAPVSTVMARHQLWRLSTSYTSWQNQEASRNSNANHSPAGSTWEHEAQGQRERIVRATEKVVSVRGQKE